MTWASDDFERARKLGPRIMSASTVEQRETALKTAQAQLAAAKNALSVAQADRTSRDAERLELLVRIVAHRSDRARAGHRQPALGQGRRDRRRRRRAAVPHHQGRRDRPRSRSPRAVAARLAVGMPAKLRLPGVDGRSRRHRCGWSIRKSTRRAAPARCASRSPTSSRARIGAFASGEVDLARARRRRRAGVRAAARRRARARAGRARRTSSRSAGSRRASSRATRWRFATALAEGETLVARAAAFLRPGDRGAADGRRRRAGAREPPMRLNVSAWSIRKPIPAIVGVRRAVPARRRQLSHDVDHAVSRTSTFRSCRC